MLVRRGGGLRREVSHAIMFVNVVSVNDVSGPPSGVGPASWFGIRINHTWSDVKSPVYLISLGLVDWSSV